MTQSSPLPDWLFRPVTALELHIMVMLLNRANNGYGLALAINEQLRPIVPSTASGVRRALTRLEQHNLVSQTDRINTSGRQEHFYELTELGRAQAERELTHLGLLLDLADNYLTLPPNIR